MINLNFTKFFEVKSPLGLEQNNKEKNAQYHSVGVDMYMPIVTEEFIKKLLENKNYLISGKNSDLTYFNINSIHDELIMSYYDNTYYIYGNIQIPTGIGILIPKEYHINIRSKSSNFGNYYSSIEGLIDENYTYGMGVQIITIGNTPVIIKPNEKFAQIELIKSNFIDVMTEIDLIQWENLEEVKSRRENRKGGFGSSNKFD